VSQDKYDQTRNTYVRSNVTGDKYYNLTWSHILETTNIEKTNIRWDTNMSQDKYDQTRNTYVRSNVTGDKYYNLTWSHIWEATNIEKDKYQKWKIFLSLCMALLQNWGTFLPTLRHSFAKRVGAQCNLIWYFHSNSSGPIEWSHSDYGGPL